MPSHLVFMQFLAVGQFGQALRCCIEVSERKSCRALPAFVNGKTQKLNEANGLMGMGVGAATWFRATGEFWYRLLTGPVW